MKKFLSLSVVVLACAAFVACGNSGLQLHKESKPSIDNMSLYVDLSVKDYQDGIVTVELFNQSGYTMIYGEEYSLQKYENEEWVDVKAKRAYTWNEIAHEIKDMETVELQYDLSVFGSLKAGRYRLIKNDMMAEFELEKK